MIFESKEKKQKRLEAEAAAKEEAEFEAKMVAKQEKKKVGKTIEEVDKAMKALMEKAAAAKSKGYEDIYRQCLSLIKVTKARKMQAEKFLFQVEAMETMQSISKGSEGLLQSMNSIMGTLGKLSVDKSVMINTQRNFGETQRKLEMESNNLEQFLSGMEMHFDDGSSDQFSDSSIEDEVNQFMMGNAIDDSKVSVSSSGADSELEAMKKMLNC